jgi:hypothetical protein
VKRLVVLVLLGILSACGSATPSASSTATTLYTTTTESVASSACGQAEALYQVALRADSQGNALLLDASPSTAEANDVLAAERVTGQYAALSVDARSFDTAWRRGPQDDLPGIEDSLSTFTRDCSRLNPP